MSDRDRVFGEGEAWAELKLLQAEYATFRPFLFDVIEGLMGFTCTALQIDIADYLETGPTKRMIQAQRGQAKTTITAAYAVWRLIHDPTTRVFIISSGTDMAQEISGWIIQIINGMEELACMRPNKVHGDRSSVKAFDVNYVLKGPEKSPSIACVGITSNLQGKRADLLIADDIESAKNSMSETQRARLVHLSRDFTSICSVGEIIYLGTPQSIDSVYNGLYSRGYQIRVWPGRYPTEEEEQNYGDRLAPSIRAAMEANPKIRHGGGPMGDRGKPTDPVLLNEQHLLDKEIDQGKAYFQLQHMLDTKLSDADRFPLKAEKIIFMAVNHERLPIYINFQPDMHSRIIPPMDWPIQQMYYRPQSFGEEFTGYSGTHMFVDPAGGGQNGDETAYAVTRLHVGRVVLVDVGGVKGGLDQAQMDELTAIAAKWKPHLITIEENYGKGALSSVWQPTLLRKVATTIEDEWVSGQKELRIIDVLEPIIGAGKFIVDEDLLRRDWESTSHYPVQDRPSFSLWYQLSRITREKGALLHDDRLDAVAGSAKHWLEGLRVDDEKARVAAQRETYAKMMKDPLGNGRTPSNWRGELSRRQPNAFDIVRRR